MQNLHNTYNWSVGKKNRKWKEDQKGKQSNYLQNVMNFFPHQTYLKKKYISINKICENCDKIIHIYFPPPKSRLIFHLEKKQFKRKC